MVHNSVGTFDGRHVTMTNGLSMYTRTSTNGVDADEPTIVLIHGLAVSSRYMMPTAMKLTASFHVFLPDLPGFGRSANPPHVLNIDELADALAAWIQTMKLSSVTFLGNSMGCQVIVNLPYAILNILSELFS